MMTSNKKAESETREIPYASMTVDQLLSEFGSSHHGLSNEEASDRQRIYGPNIIKSETRSSALAILLDQFRDPLIYLLIGAAVVSIALGHTTDAWIVIAVLLLNAVIGFTQEYRADKALESLASMVAPKAKVLRSGKVMDVDASALVPGDMVIVASGDRVPADMRIVEMSRLHVEEAALTGESIGVPKQVEPVDDIESGPAGRKNTLFMGTSVVSGRGRALVVATGLRTELGKITKAVSDVDDAPTPLEIQMRGFSKFIGAAVIGLSALTVVLGIIVGVPFATILFTAIALAVAAIPEGLPVVVTVAFAVGVRRMARRNAIIRRLPAVETLGSCTVIASDKTGTLTKNEMTVEEIRAGGRSYNLGETGIQLEGKPLSEPDLPRHQALLWTLKAGLYANEAQISQGDDGNMSLKGDPTETALITAANRAGLDIAGTGTKLDEMPFESEKMFMASLMKADGSENLVFVKGAPERVLSMCASFVTGDGQEHPLSPEEKSAALDEARRMGARGLRVLAMAYRRTNQAGLGEDSLEGLVFAGFQGMVDPPRPEAIDAVRKARRAGIRVIMVTGDHRVTASAIAGQFGLASGSEVITGHDMESMDDDALAEALSRTNVYARVSPLDKLRIVKTLLGLKQVVAVTGDGVNDAPALKAAHIGVAMGRTGTDVAREASDMVITDDNFASIFEAVKEGRVVFDNIRKVIFFLLPTGIGVVLTILYTLIAGLPLPFRPAQILWLNLVTNGLQDVALAFEPGEKSVEWRGPRHPNEPIMTSLLIQRLVIVGIVLMLGTVFAFQWDLGRGGSLERAQTVALTTAVLFQMFHVFNSRSERESLLRISLLSNPFLLISVVLALTAHLALIYTPLLQRVFRSSPLDIRHWTTIVPIAAVVILVVEFEKWIRRRRSPGPGA